METKQAVVTYMFRKECLAEFSRGCGEVSSGDEGDSRAQDWLG